MIETVASILDAYRTGAVTPADIVARSYQRIREYADPAVFISLREEADAIAEAKALDLTELTSRPLYGIPVAIKDNIDVAGLATTAACPAFSYRPAQDSAAAARLRAAGAIIIGKTNLDQFATGLVGVRSPYGIPRNAINSALVPGGSSSGSAVAVSAGLVPLALGTDTAGSGRVPAGLGNIVGLKPSLGLISTRGVLPACRTLDCVSIFALTADDAWSALEVLGAPDEQEPYSRNYALNQPGPFHPGIRLGVPRPDQREFFGDDRFVAHYEHAISRARELGATLVEIDFQPFSDTARLLYDGPWIAERYLVIRALLEKDPEAVHPVTRAITLQGAKPSAADTFEAMYKLESLRRLSERTFANIDALLLPTAPSAYTVDQVLADPVRLNSQLGTYTNFVNLLDLCGIAVPFAISPDRVPFGVTIIAPAGRDDLALSIGRTIHLSSGLPLGARGAPYPVAAEPAQAAATADEIELAVVGAHLSGMPLNRELVAAGARLIETNSTAPDYRLYALAGSAVPKPGLLRVGQGSGTSIAVEVWSLPPAGFGQFVASLPQPMTIGTITLNNGRAVKGFLVEAEATHSAQDISVSGGWKAFLAN